MNRKPGIPLWVKFIGVILVVLAFFIGAFLLTTVPSGTYYSPSMKQVSAEKLRRHVEVLSVEFAPRNYKRIQNLNQCADYIADHFAQAGATVSNQTFAVNGRSYRNVIASFGDKSEPQIVVGAHYDSCQDTPGADDNASGVAGLLELAYLLGQTNLNQHVQLVAYTLEEPPFFRTGNMGSARHASSLRRENVEVEAMICLEMIGYFSDVEKSQRYPSTLLKLFYPNVGNYISVVGSTGDRALLREVKISMRSATDLPVHAMCASKGFPGLDFSDHRNYWNHGYKAVMVTDTAFMRNRHYHALTDTADRLDYNRMSNVVLGVYEAVVRLANGDVR